MVRETLNSFRVAALLGLGLLAVMTCATPRSTLHAAELNAADQLVQEQIAAGEFAPAQAAIHQNGDGGRRDALLGQLAAAQAQAGARNASLQSAGKIGNDVARADAFANLGRKTTAAAGGGVQPDFQSLIDLITSTIAPTSWTEVGGVGAIQEFRSGVLIDAAGMVHRRLKEDHQDWLKELRQQSRVATASHSSVRAASGLRKISLTRLEREVQTRLATGEPLEEDIAYLAGLQRVQYIMVYPDTGDLVIAGPAGGWQRDGEGRVVSVDTGRPVVQLNDLVCLLRTFRASPNASLSCSIDPRPENLAAAQEFIAASSGRPLKPGERNAWLENIRKRVGAQDVRFTGVDPHSRVAQILFEADYHMKLVGIGLEDGVPGVVNYLDSVKPAAGNATPPMDVLRWWFTMNYNALTKGDDGQAYELHGQGVQVLSENEFLIANGKRQHSGKADPLNQQYSNSFTQHFSALTKEYPIYAELQNVFDLALVAALLESEHLPDQVGWHMTCFNNPREYMLPTGAAPKAVDSVMNHRVIKGRQIVAAVSGGVLVDPRGELKKFPAKPDTAGKLGSERDRAQASKSQDDRWWWD